MSGVGEPNAGAVTLQAPRRPGFRRPEPPKPGARSQAPARRSLFGLKVVYALTPDGLLRTMLVSNGYDHEPPVEFLPPNANAHGLIVVDGVAYVTTSNGCAGVADGVWALDLETKQVSSWKAGAGSIVGTAGPVIAPDGTVYVATADGRVAGLDPKTLERKAVHQSGTRFVSSPMLIDINDKDYLAVAAADGSVHLLEAGKLDGPAAAKTPAGGAGGALATWRDEAGEAWLLATAENAVTAWKIVDADGGLAFERGWTSSRIASPLQPIIVNGVVFAASGGSAAAVVYALDAATGKTVWDSGDAIKSPAPSGGLSAGGGRVYLGTLDGALHAFGFPLEH